MDRSYTLIRISEKNGSTITLCNTDEEATDVILSETPDATTVYAASGFRLMRDCGLEAYKNTENIIWMVIDGSYISLNIPVPGGKLNATNGDIDYPGIDIEYIPENDDSNILARPRVLMEKPVDSNQLVAMIWSDPDNEDYSEKITF